MGGLGQGITQVFIAVIGLAVIAVIVSRRSDSGNIINQAFSGFSNSIRSAVSPVTGGVGQGLAY